MFSKGKIKHQLDAKALIYKVPGTAFKKGQTLDIPQGYEACLFAADGTQELIQDVYKHKLESPIQYIYLSKSNRASVQSKWGTPNRISVKTNAGRESLGAFGHIEFQLLNPIRFLEKRSDQEGHIDESLLTQLALSRIGEAFQEVLPALEPIDSTNLNALIKALKSPLKRTLELKISNYGMSVTDITIDSVNFQREEAS